MGEWRVEMVRVVWWDGVSKDLFSDEAHPEEQLVLGTLVASARFFLGFPLPHARLRLTAASSSNLHLAL